MSEDKALRRRFDWEGSTRASRLGFDTASGGGDLCLEKNKQRREKLLVTRQNNTSPSDVFIESHSPSPGLFVAFSLERRPKRAPLVLSVGLLHPGLFNPNNKTLTESKISVDALTGNVDTV